MHLTHTLTLHILLIFLAKYREFKYVPLIRLERTPLEHVGSTRKKSFYYQQVLNHMSSLILFQLHNYIYFKKSQRWHDISNKSND
jgi:hypothetical protein